VPHRRSQRRQEASDFDRLAYHAVRVFHACIVHRLCDERRIEALHQRLNGAEHVDVAVRDRLAPAGHAARGLRRADHRAGERRVRVHVRPRPLHPAIG
jgi:hypothetical protein